MDNLRGYLGAVDYDTDGHDFGLGDEDAVREPPPSPIGQDERRMQVRAYNHWASLIGDGAFPSIEDLAPETLTDFGPFSVLLDFTNGVDDPAVRYLGATLAEECDVPTTIGKLSDVPGRSLLSRITDHYMQILANQAPIGFEAEFVNQRGAAIMYRGILLPYSSDDDTIDFILGVINWKEMADQLTSDELLLEVDQALEDAEARPRASDPVTDWADGPGADQPAPLEARSPLSVKPGASDPFPLPAFGNDDETGEADDGDEAGIYEAIEAVDDEPEGPSRFASLLTLGGGSGGDFADDDDYDDDDDEDPVAKWLARPTPLEALPEPAFGTGESHETIRQPLDLDALREAYPVEDDEEPFELVDEQSAEAPADEYEPLELIDAIETPMDEAVDAVSVHGFEPLELVEAIEPEAADITDSPIADDNIPVDEQPLSAELPDGDEGLYDCLAQARELALAARSCEDRSRTALYAAVGRAYDFSLAAQAEPEEFAELIADSGLTVQDRAPMTPVVKLVFGADYDKTRLTEYAAVLTHAHRMGIERGALAGYLGAADGGLKGVVQAERALRRSDDGEDAVRETPREALARKLRAIAPLGFEDIDAEGEEFSLVMIRRVDGAVVVLGEVDELALVEKVAKRLVA